MCNLLILANAEGFYLETYFIMLQISVGTWHYYFAVG